MHMLREHTALMDTTFYRVPSLLTTYRPESQVHTLHKGHIGAQHSVCPIQQVAYTTSEYMPGKTKLFLTILTFYSDQNVTGGFAARHNQQENAGSVQMEVQQRLHASLAFRHKNFL